MNIGVNGRTFSVEEPDGAVQTAMRLTDGLNKRGNNVSVFGNEKAEPNNRSIDLDTTGYFLDSQVYGVLWERTILPLLLKRYSLDVFYAPNGNAPIQQIQTPVVMCIHDVNAQLGMSSTKHQLYRKLAVPPAAKAADLITTVSKFSKREITDILSVPESKIRVVYNGIDQYFLDDGQGKKVQVPEKYILFVGKLSPRKNIKRAIEAFKRAKRSAALPHKLLFVGGRDSLIYQDMDLKQEDIIHIGYVSKESLKYVYNEASILLYPSLYEGFGIPPLEAMACGTPVVASDAAAFPEILSDSAELPDPYDVDDISDSILTILQNKRKREVMIEKGRKRSEKFTWENAVDSLENVLKEASN